MSSLKKVSHVDDTTTNTVNGPVPSHETSPDADIDALRVVLPPSTVAEDFDLSTLRAPATPTAVAVPVDGGIDVVRCQKPASDEFVYLHPTWREYLYMILAKFGSREANYVVIPTLAEAHLDICRRVLIVPYSDQDHNFFLWPVPQENRRGDINEFHQSLMSQMARSIGKWCKYEAVTKTRSYNLFEAVDQREEPPWPPGGLPFLIRKAFKDRVIATPNHPVLMKRRSHLK